MARTETRSPEEATPEDEEPRAEEGGTGRGGAGETIAHELKQAVREAALEVLGPAARHATSSAAQYAVRKGPDLVTKNVIPAVSKAGGAGGLVQEAMSKGGQALSGSGGIGGLAGKLLSKVGGGRGGRAATGWGKGRRMPVQQYVYVSVPLRHTYDGWTEYKQWPKYMHRANQSDAQIDDREARVKVTEKMWGFTRPFTAEVVTQLPDQRIKWNATEGVKHTGVINFHELGPRLTLVEVNVDHSPSGPVEKLARGARFVKRAVRADFHRFQAWIEMKDDDELEELEGWRGTIEGGRIVKSHEEALEEEQGAEVEEDRAGPEAGEEEPEGEAEEEETAELETPEADAGEEEEIAEIETPEADAGEEEEEPEPPRVRRPRPRTRQQPPAEQAPRTSTRGQPRRRRSEAAAERGSEGTPARPQPRTRAPRQHPGR